MLVITGRTARQPWSNGALVARACAALAERGHTITLAAQSVDDPALFARCERIHTFESFDQTATDWPAGFASWANRQRRNVAHDVSMSFARVAGADVWLPLEPSGGAWLAQARRSLSFKSLAISVTRHHGAIRAWASDAFFVVPPTGEDAPIRRVLAVGSTAAGETARALHRAHGLGERVLKVDPFTMTPAGPLDQRATLRAATRRMLDIAPDRRVVLISVPQGVGRLLDPLFTAARDLAERNLARSPILLALAKDCFALHDRAGRCAAAANVRILGLSERFDAALAASDAVALPIRAARGLFHQGGAARLGADALGHGKPLLALSGASGYGLARVKSSLGDAPGLVIDHNSPGEWGRAMAQLADDDWLGRATAAAIEIGAPMPFERFGATLEILLADTAAERAEGRGI